MYILALMGDDVNLDLLVALLYYTNLSEAIEEGRKYVKECPGNYFQIYQPVADSAKMEVIMIEPEEDK
jgi:hypothetical protein